MLPATSRCAWGCNTHHKQRTFTSVSAGLSQQWHSNCVRYRHVGQHASKRPGPVVNTQFSLDPYSETDQWAEPVEQDESPALPVELPAGLELLYGPTSSINSSNGNGTHAPAATAAPLVLQQPQQSGQGTQGGESPSRRQAPTTGPSNENSRQREASPLRESEMAAVISSGLATRALSLMTQTAPQEQQGIRTALSTAQGATLAGSRQLSSTGTLDTGTLLGTDLATAPVAWAGPHGTSVLQPGAPAQDSRSPWTIPAAGSDPLALQSPVDVLTGELVLQRLSAAGQSQDSTQTSASAEGPMSSSRAMPGRSRAQQQRSLPEEGSADWTTALTDMKSDQLFVTVPSRLRPGCPAVLLVNKARSSTLRECKTLSLQAGFNINWSIKQPELEMQPLAWTADAPLHRDDNSDWWQACFMVPQQAYEMHFVLSGLLTQQGQEQRLWDTNSGASFYLRVWPGVTPAPSRSQPAPAAISSSDTSNSNTTMSGDTVLRHIKAQLAAHPQPIADKNVNKLYFTIPEQLVAGAPATLYFNKRRSPGFADQQHIHLHYGWNNWSVKLLPGGMAAADLHPTVLHRDDPHDWWSASFQVPTHARELNFAFTNGSGLWDSNGGADYSATVVPMSGAPSPVLKPRQVQETVSMPHGQGTLHIVTLGKRSESDPILDQQARWSDEKTLRVWTPPGWSLDRAPAGGWPVLYMADGQNLFEDWLAHQGVAWRVGYQVSDLISRGELPPFILVGIDSPGALRTYNYLPYTPGKGPQGIRPDAERLPGGGLAQYLQRVTEEILPVVQTSFGASKDPALRAFGGSSFAGICALYAAMHYPHVFGSVLVESPSLWVAEGAFLGDLAAHTGPLPERVYVGAGTNEYTCSFDSSRQDVDELLLQYITEAARLLQEKGCRPEQGRLRLHVEPGAGHQESAWQARFSSALRYLLSPWWQLVPRTA